MNYKIGRIQISFRSMSHLSEFPVWKDALTLHQSYRRLLLNNQKCQIHFWSVELNDERNNLASMCKVGGKKNVAITVSENNFIGKWKPNQWCYIGI